MKSEKLIKIFKDFLEEEKTDYALLLNGAWGSGKTHYWKHKLSPIVKNRNYKPIYVSLNGISKIEDLEQALFLKLIPLVGRKENKLLKNSTTIITNTINQFSKVFIKTNLSDIFKGVSINTLIASNYFICFDDLERCQMSIKEVFGFINNYVEHQNLKTIILADEKNIPPNNKEEGYDYIKEKIIGRILNFEPNLKEIFPELLQVYNEESDFYTFILERQESIINIFHRYNINNLRVISFYLNTLYKIFPEFKGLEEPFINEIAFFSALITNEFKVGNLESSDYTDYKGLDNIQQHLVLLDMSPQYRNGQKEKTDQKKNYMERFYEKYLKNNIDDYSFYPSIYIYILTGYLDLSMLKKEIKKQHPEEISEEVRDFRQLLNYKFRELSNEYFKTLTENVLSYAKEGRYSIYDYLQIARFYYFFEKNDLIQLSWNEIKSSIQKGINIARKRKETNDMMMDNIDHFSDQYDDIIEIKNLVKEAHYEIKKEQYVSESNELIKVLKNNDAKALANFMQKHQLSTELLVYIDSDDLFNTLLSISNKQLFNFTELLSHRYRSVNIGDFLYNDLDTLNYLKESLEDYCDKNDKIQEPQRFLLKSLIEELNSIIAHIKKSKK